VKDFRDLSVWRKAHQLTLAVYRATAPFPKTEMFGLTAQLRRSTVSIAANIAEGCGRGSNADFARFLQQAMGSASETEYHLLVSRDLGFLDHAPQQGLQTDVVEVKRMLASLLRRVRSGS